MQSHAEPSRPVPDGEAVVVVRANLIGPGLDSFEALYRSNQRPGFFAAAVRDFGPGGTRHPQYTWDEIGRGLLECGATSGEVTPQKLAGFLRKVREGVPGTGRGPDAFGDALSRIPAA